MSKRIQRSRKKGWRKPEGAVIVDRTSRFGNPFSIGKYVEGKLIETNTQAVGAFEEMLTIEERNYPSNDEIRGALRGKDLICFCALDQPCHADVLLEKANRDE